MFRFELVTFYPKVKFIGFYHSVVSVKRRNSGTYPAFIFRAVAARSDINKMPMLAVTAILSEVLIEYSHYP
jgi:hypothetical protein